MAPLPSFGFAVNLVTPYKSRTCARIGATDPRKACDKGYASPGRHSNGFERDDMTTLGPDGLPYELEGDASPGKTAPHRRGHTQTRGNPPGPPFLCGRVADAAPGGRAVISFLFCYVCAIINETPRAWWR